MDYIILSHSIACLWGGGGGHQICYLVVEGGWVQNNEKLLKVINI